MIRHIFMAPLKQDASPDAAQIVINEINKMPYVAHQITSFSAEVNLALYQNTMQIAFTADFEDVPAWESYMKNPEHLNIGKSISQYLDNEKLIVFQMILTP